MAGRPVGNLDGISVPVSSTSLPQEHTPAFSYSFSSTTPTPIISQYQPSFNQFPIQFQTQPNNQLETPPNIQPKTQLHKNDPTKKQLQRHSNKRTKTDDKIRRELFAPMTSSELDKLIIPEEVSERPVVLALKSSQRFLKAFYVRLSQIIYLQFHVRIAEFANPGHARDNLLVRDFIKQEDQAFHSTGNPKGLSSDPLQGKEKLLAEIARDYRDLKAHQGEVRDDRKKANVTKSQLRSYDTINAASNANATNTGNDQSYSYNLTHNNLNANTVTRKDRIENQETDKYLRPVTESALDGIEDVINIVSKKSAIMEASINSLPPILSNLGACINQYGQMFQSLSVTGSKEIDEIQLLKAKVDNCDKKMDNLATRMDNFEREVVDIKVGIMQVKELLSLLRKD